MRVLLVTGSGSALLDLLAMRPWWERYDTSWVAVAAADTTSALAGHLVTWVPSPAGPWRAYRILRKSRPHLVVSASPPEALPFFLVARLSRVPALWIGTPSCRAARLARETFAGELY
ncbi:hypothetical protein ACFQS1_01415 [Paractinoplanes rhizophilus]|jgi:hypothetical protein|uniref:Uncharacterized protein n=1 Tax=Paractinoplanes rhizophilus TaxID=1416877 RepID=A0ABW2HJ25_9ACTN|nr:hypothetical protein [Actinoplanes sp.]